MRSRAGQATVEMLALLPVVALVALVLLQALAAGAARELAGHAAEAGAVALAEGADPRAAARDAVPGWSRSGLRVSVRAGAVEVRMRPPGLLPGVAGLLTASAVARTAP